LTFIKNLSFRLLFLASITWFFVRCSNEQKETKLSEQGVFSLYIEETFSNKILVDSNYFIIIGKQICSYCEKGTVEGFKNQQEKIKSSIVTLITDFTKEEIDTLLLEDFKPKILFDTLGNFGNYNFPRSYITIYKVIDGNIADFAYFSEDAKLNLFLEKESLRPPKY